MINQEQRNRNPYVIQFRQLKGVQDLETNRIYLVAALVINACKLPHSTFKVIIVSRYNRIPILDETTIDTLPNEILSKAFKSVFQKSTFIDPCDRIRSKSSIKLSFAVSSLTKISPALLTHFQNEKNCNPRYQETLELLTL